MSKELYKAARTTIDDFYSLNADLSQKDDHKEITDNIYRITRVLEISCNDLMHQGVRIAITSNYVYECPDCAKELANSDMLYVHFRKRHSDDDDVAAAVAHNGKQKYDTDITKLRNLLIKHTESLLEEDDPFQEKS